MSTLAEKQRIESVTIESVAAQGKCLAKHEGQVIFVDHAAVGDIATIEITETRSQFAKAKIHQLESASNDRTEPFCEHYRICGGCQLQHIDYDAQQGYKLDHLNTTLPKLSKLSLPEITTLHSADRKQAFRNKVTFSFGHDCWQATPSDEKLKGLGFHAFESPETIIDIAHCHIIPDLANDIAKATKQLAIVSGLSFYRHAKQQGLLKDLVLRWNDQQQYMLVLHTGYQLDDSHTLVREICKQFPEIQTAYVYTEGADDNALTHIHGNERLVDTLGSLSFEISPLAFYQTNAEQAKRLYNRVKALANLQAHHVVYDLYCGTGTIGLWLANAVKKVIGVEVLANAVDDANRNAALNNIENAAFFQGHAETVISPQFLKRNGKPDVVIVDPPRAGLDKRLCKQLGELSPKQIVYVSCDPATQARDFARLAKEYEVKTIEAVDMFPHSFHCETVALLQRKRKQAKTVKRGLKY